MLGPAPALDRHRHDQEQERGNGQLLLGDVRRGAYQTGLGDLRRWRYASRGRADVPGVGARDWGRGARGDQPGRHGVQAGGVQGVLRAHGRGRRAGGYPGFREIAGEPECLDRGAEVPRDLAGAGAHDQQPGPGADHFVPGPGPDTNDGDPRAYAFDPHRDAAAADSASDAHAVTRKPLRGPSPCAGPGWRPLDHAARTSTTLRVQAWPTIRTGRSPAES